MHVTVYNFVFVCICIFVTICINVCVSIYVCLHDMCVFAGADPGFSERG